jgi:CLIP-associating protein 1/2
MRWKMPMAWSEKRQRAQSSTYLGTSSLDRASEWDADRERLRSAPDHAKVDLKKQLIQRRVRKTIAAYILVQLGLSDEGGSAAPPPKTSDRPKSAHQPQFRQEAQSYATAPASQSPSAGSKSDLSLSASISGPPGEPGISQTVHTSKELDIIFRDMLPFFDGKESEQNWSNREKSIIKLGNITRGNAPHEFTAAYIAGIRSLLDGILKTVNSLRTTVSTNGCQFVQEVARVVGPGLDPMVEILLQSLIKLCGGTKKISAANGNLTVDAILGNVSYNIRLLQHIWGACQDKNIQPRRYATGWLKTIIIKHGNHKSHLEHSGGAELMQKCVTKGLEDSDKDVRESMRSTYWKFAAIWPDRADV